MDLSETKDGFIVKAELPGLDGKDVDVGLSGNILTIKGERKRRRKRTSIIIMWRGRTALSSVPFSFRLK
ncbi:MAG: Hsp20/alpha crystallin family protein [Thermodesulfobacteriota bacterium]|nr:Hsp20/alpha crystallin family protein [Thermodesulfobacteriota bacterium]